MESVDKGNKMPTTDIVRLQAEVEALKRLYERDMRDQADRMEDVEKRLAGYDLLAAKWGGILIITVALGGGMITFWEKIRSFVLWASHD